MPDDLNSVKTASTRKRGAYHHGDLRHALLEVGEAVLGERGPSGFSLREVARRAGVSPAAPAHHFGDARGLLTALATRGFERLIDALQRAGEERAPDCQLRAQAEAYVGFALGNGPLFSLMWARDMLDTNDAAYLAAGRKAFNLFERVATGQDVPVATAPRMPDPAVIAAWSMIHGYARLALDGALGEAGAELLPAVLRHLPNPAQPV